jgi:hypothetical protein
MQVDYDTFTPERVTVLFGAFGSGKTEIALNLAIGLASKHDGVSLVDIDIVKPMFRSREMRKTVVAAGIRMVDTMAGLENADLPIVTGEVDALLGSGGGRVVVDVGGDHLGARALGRYAGRMVKRYDALYVINTRRPFASNTQEIMKMMEMVEEASRLRTTGLIANTNLGIESSVELALEGFDIVSSVSRKTGVPIRCIAIYDQLIHMNPQIAADVSLKTGLPVLPLKRYLLKPWEI